MNPQPQQKGKEGLDNVVDLEQTYGYDKEQEEAQKEKGGDEWLKILLAHLKEKKKLYMRPITP